MMSMAVHWPVRPCRRFVNIIGDIYPSVLLYVIWHCAFFGSEVKVNIVDDDHDDDRTSCRLDFFSFVIFLQYFILFKVDRLARTHDKRTYKSYCISVLSFIKKYFGLFGWRRNAMYLSMYYNMHCTSRQIIWKNHKRKREENAKKFIRKKTVKMNIECVRDWWIMYKSLCNVASVTWASFDEQNIENDGWYRLSMANALIIVCTCPLHQVWQREKKSSLVHASLF